MHAVSSPVQIDSVHITSQLLIEERLEARLTYYAAHPREISARLKELDKEWHIERLLNLNAATLAGFGTLMSLYKGKQWLALPAGASGLLIQHALKGSSVPADWLRQLGFRTAEEINEERYALKLIRGDFDEMGELDVDQAVEDIERAMAAAEG